jgi:uncharacterized membrane protein
MVTNPRWTSRRALLRSIDSARVKRAIETAEKDTSGQICVSFAPFFWGDVDRAAVRALERLGTKRAGHRNGVLILVAPARRRFVVCGDGGIHAKVGDVFWEDVCRLLGARFREGDFTEGLVQAIAVIGEQLRLHFPAEPTNARHDGEQGG